MLLKTKKKQKGSERQKKIKPGNKKQTEKERELAEIENRKENESVKACQNSLDIENNMKIRNIQTLVT